MLVRALARIKTQGKVIYKNKRKQKVQISMTWDRGQSINWTILGRVRIANIENFYAIAVLTAIIPCQERMSAKVRKVLHFQI